MNYSLSHLSWVYSILGHTRWQQLSLLYSCLRVSVKIRALGSQWQTISLPPPKTPDPQKRRVCAPENAPEPYFSLSCGCVLLLFWPFLYRSTFCLSDQVLLLTPASLTLHCCVHLLGQKTSEIASVLNTALNRELLIFAIFIIMMTPN